MTGVMAAGARTSTPIAATATAERRTWQTGHRDLSTGPVVIAHRGASGYRPEHTLAAYALAIAQGAAFIEPDLVSTADGVLVARHENEIGGTTDVASHPRFATRRTTKVVDGRTVTGWFTEDFTLEELKSLRAVERIPHLRAASAFHDGLEEIPTLEEVIDLAQRSRTMDGGAVGVYPETKHPSYFASLGLGLEERLVSVLHASGYRGANGAAMVQSFEVGNLRRLRRMTDLPLVQLVAATGAPWDLTVAGSPSTYRDLVTPAGLDVVASYATAIGAAKDVLIPRGADGDLGRPSPVIEEAHRRGLLVHGWTFRRENEYLPPRFRRGCDPAAPGDVVGELSEFLAAGMDGFFTDNPDLGVLAVTRSPEAPAPAARGSARG